MTEVVIDTNVLLVANFSHPDVSEACVEACIDRLNNARANHKIVVDDNYLAISEYSNKLNPNCGKGVGDAFLKWLLQNAANEQKVIRVRLTSLPNECFAEFPDPIVEPDFDPPDRKFAAISNAHPAKPPIWQAADCKWLDWAGMLAAHGIVVDFLCLDDVCRFYDAKFPGKLIPELP